MEKTYRGREADVRFDLERCIHAAECVRRLPAVFDTERRPWITPDAASAEALAEAIGHCPTGALHLDAPEGGPEEAPDAVNTVEVRPDGPLYVRGDVRVEDADGAPVVQDTRLALCRCGRSANKPFCDNAHREAGFRDGGHWEDAKLSGDAEGSGRLTIRTAPGGPLLLEGPVRLPSADGAPACAGAAGALCRCGASASKPFCDGSHARVGFQDP